MKSYSSFLLTLSLASFCPHGASQSAATTSTIFQMGTFDGASDDFARGTSREAASFVVGQSNPALDWPSSQRAVTAERAGSGSSSARTIQFDISNVQKGAYRLQLAFLIESRSVPSLRVGINGRYGTFYVESGLHARMGGFDDTFESVYGSADLAITFPESYLHKGSNLISLLPVQKPGRNIPDASITYDAIQLDRIASADHTQASSASILPSVYYKDDGGRLEELVEVYLAAGRRAMPGDSVEFSIAGKQYRQTLHPHDDFGEQRFEFWVPEFKAGTSVRLSGRVCGKSFNKEQTIDPQKKWTLFLVPHIHLDVGYSDYQPKVAAIQTLDMDEAIDMADRHPGFTFSVDGAWDLDQFMKTRTPADQQRAIEAIKQGRLFVPAQYADLLTGFPTAETLIRSLYPAARFSQEHGTPFNYANITDVPSYSWSYASVLAAAGIKYFVAGPNGHETRAPVLLQGRLNEHSPFWWVGPDGGKVLFWYCRHYWEGGILFGVPPTASAGLDTVPMFLKTYAHPEYRADAAIVFGTQGENTDLHPEQATLASEWNKQFAFPKLQYSGFYGALHTIAQQFGDSVPTVSGDGGPYWEDGIASNARLASLERRNESRAPSVEKLATLAALVDSRIAPDKADLNRMWTNMVLMDEHTWNSHDSVSDTTSEETAHQSGVKAFYALDARQAADFIARNSMANLAQSIPADRGSLIVFNTLNWTRDALVTFDLEKGHEIFDPSTKETVPVEVLRQSPHLLHVRFMARDLPSFGYKVFQLRASSQMPAATEAIQVSVLESPFYRVELDPASGAVRSIFDKQLKRELVNRESPYRFGQYVYVSGGDTRPNTLLQYRTIALEPKLKVDSAQNGRLLSVTRTPYGWVARMQCSDTNTPAIASEIRLFEHEKKIEFMENVEKTAVTTREGVYFAFPFAIDHPQFRYEIQNGVVNPAKNMYPGAGHEWFSVQHWVNVSNDQSSATVMPLDAPLVTLGELYRGQWPAEFGERPGTVFSFAMNNYWSTNYDASQGGQIRLRYVITSSKTTDEAELSRMGWEDATPIELNEVTAQDKAQNPEAQGNPQSATYLAVNDAALLVEDWKPAEDGNGTILRLLDLGGETRQVTLRTPLLDIDHAIQADAVERNQAELQLAGPHAFTLTVHPHEILTVRVVPRSRASQNSIRRN